MSRAEHDRVAVSPDAALLVIDMQNDFLLEGAPLESRDGRAVLPTVAALRDRFRAAGLPVIYTTGVHDPDAAMGAYRDIHPAIAAGQALRRGSRGAAVHDQLAPAPSEHVVQKRRYSAFFETDLEARLDELGVRQLVITGVTTENCVLSTARDAMFRGIGVIVVGDACASYDYPDRGWGAMTGAEVHRAALVVLATSTGPVVAAEDLVLPG